MRPTLLIDDRMADVKNPFATRRGVRHRSGPFHLRKRTVERTGTWKTPHDLERCSALFTKRLQTEEYIDGGSYSEVPWRCASGYPSHMMPHDPDSSHLAEKPVKVFHL